MKKYITAFFMAWGYFLALPCPHKKWDNSIQHIMLAFLPAIGMVAGALWCLWAYFLRLFSLPIEIESLATMSFIFFISGFFHLDGFMDTCDALLSRRDMIERQRILKDSTVGAFSVISVILLISWWIVTFVFVIGIPDYWMLFLIPVISRTMSAIHVLTRKPIGHSQYKDGFTSSERKMALYLTVLLATIGVIISAILLKLTGGETQTLALTVVLMISISFAFTANATKQLGGMSGDISGYGICLTELFGVITVAISMS